MKLSIAEQIKRIKAITNRPEFEACHVCRFQWLPFGKQFEDICPRCKASLTFEEGKIDLEEIDFVSRLGDEPLQIEDLALIRDKV